MAYAALTSLADVIHQILPHHQRYIFLCGQEQMTSLHENVSRLQEFLENISLKPPSPASDELESRIRDTAHKMEDTIELVILTEPGKESESDVKIPTPDEFSSCFDKVSVLLEEAMKMEETIDNNAIPEALRPLSTTTSSTEASGSKGTKAELDDKTIGDALNGILDQLTGQGSELRIIPITGMGGIGKTYLARASFEAPLTQRRFDVRFWVTVSQDYNIKDVLRGLLPEAERSMHDNEQKLFLKVYQSLRGRRFLIVLDDMWNEKVWDLVKNAFSDNNKGSRVILTTRELGVVSYVGSSSPVHEMKFLNKDQSWDLLRVNVYGSKHPSTEFEGIGRKIARNCKGLPLALVVIAGLLKYNESINYWKEVAKNTNKKAMKSEDHFFEILCWSYSRLPPHLKACFLYMGTYKEDNEIPTKELVRLWAAEGFLKPKPDRRSMEEVAEECLEELVKRSLVLVTKKLYNGKIKTCSIHDVLREVSIRKAKEEKFHYHVTSPVDDESIGDVLAVQRRVSVTDCYWHPFRLPHDTFFVTTHSLIDQNGYDSKSSMSIVQCFKLLRLMYKVYVREHSQLSILFTLTNFRYLHISYDEEDTLIIVPESISKLQNLETLIVTTKWVWDTIFIVFPQEIWNLQRLRHIDVKGGVEVPVPDQSCPSLQTLSGVRNVNITESLSEMIPNLKKLKLNYTIHDGQEYSMESLQCLHKLEELSIRVSRLVEPTNFVFPESLKKLTLFGTNIPSENLSRIGSLPNLEVLKLKGYSVKGEEWKPLEGQFPQLEHLKMEHLTIRHWRAESTHFPCLRKLVILDCNWLEEVPEYIGEMYTLEMLIVRVRIEEAKRSVQRIKKTQEEFGNDLPKVIILDN